MSVFHFKEFSLEQGRSAMKVGTDAMLLGSLIEVKGHVRALDIGTGTGVLSLMVAQKNQDVIIDAVEKDASSVEDCQINFSNSKWSERLNVHHSDIKEFNADEAYDLIFSNPPYYESKLEGRDKRMADAKHTSSLPIDVFMLKANELLSDDGALWIIIQSEFEDKWLSAARENELNLTEEIRIIGKEGGEIIRKVLRFGRFNVPLNSSKLTVRSQKGEYTDKYKALTSEFHGVKL